MPLQVRTVLNHKQFSLGTGKRLLFALISTFLPPWSSNFIKFYYNSRFILHNHHILHSSVLFPQFRDIRSFPNFLSTRNRNKRNNQIFFCQQTRLLEYGFAARYQGTIGDKAKKKERAANLELEELVDSGEKNG